MALGYGAGRSLLDLHRNKGLGLNKREFYPISTDAGYD
jgi:hypothetical protein